MGFTGRSGCRLLLTMSAVKAGRDRTCGGSRGGVRCTDIKRTSAGQPACLRRMKGWKPAMWHHDYVRTSWAFQHDLCAVATSNCARRMMIPASSLRTNIATRPLQSSHLQAMTSGTSPDLGDGSSYGKMDPPSSWRSSPPGCSSQPAGLWWFFPTSTHAEVPEGVLLLANTIPASGFA